MPGALSGLTNALGLTNDRDYSAPNVDQSGFYLGGSQANSNAMIGQYNQARQNAGSQQAPSLDYGNYNYGNSLSFGADRQGQQDYIQMLRDRAMGKGPSAAELMMRQGTDDALRAQMSAANSAHAGQYGLAQRLAAEQGANLQNTNLRQAGILRAQEQQQYAQALGGALQGMREQDIAGAGQGLNYAQLQSQNALGQRQINAGLEQAYLGAQMGLQQSQLQGQEEYQRMLMQGQLGAQQLQQQQDAANSAMYGQIIGGAMGGMGSGLAMNAMRGPQPGGGGGGGFMGSGAYQAGASVSPYGGPPY